MNITGYINLKGIQRKLIISFLLLGLIPMIVMGSVSYYKSTEILLKNANSEMTNLATKAIEQLDSEFKLYRMQVDSLAIPAKQVTDMMAVGIDLDQGTKEMTGKFFTEYMTSNPVFKRIRFFDVKGDEKLSTKQGTADQGKNVSSLPWYQKALTVKEIVFSEAAVSQEMGEPIITMARAFYSQEGKPFAVLAADLSADVVTKPITDIKIGKEGFGYIINKEGMVIAYPDKTKNFQMDLTKYDFGKEIIQKKKGTREYSLDGRTRFASFQEYPALGWIIALSIDKAEILESIGAMNLLFIILGVVMAIFSLVAGVIFTVRLVKPINRIVTGLSDGSDQVASASTQVSESSQHLAEGASEQAASLEETSSSLEEMSSMTKQNADNANQAKAMMNEAKTVVEKANVQMAQLTEAIGQITRSSEETGKIIKTIDEIAFQTNLLALNAAVEAARAGEAGAGFAVVADEVRNLALRSAEAARNTSDLIEKTIKAVRNGNEMTVSTQEAFRANAELSGKISQLVDEIATASDEQAHGIAQVNIAVGEMDKVTQQTAATAEESASAAEEMSAQAQQMRGYVEELAAVIGVSMEKSGPSGMVHASPAAVRKPALMAPPAVDKKKRGSRNAQAKHTRPRPDEVIPFDQDEKDGFKDF
jgi:methyl-accepting chemotaxis protein